MFGYAILCYAMSDYDRPSFTRVLVVRSFARSSGISVLGIGTRMSALAGELAPGLDSLTLEG